MQVCRNDSARVVGRGQAGGGQPTLASPCGSACSSSAGVRAGPSRQVSDGSPRGGYRTRCRGSEVVCRCDRNHYASTGSDQMRRRVDSAARGGEAGRVMMGQGGGGRRRREGLCLPTCHKHNRRRALLFRNLALAPCFLSSLLSQPRNPAGSPDEMGQDGWCCSRRCCWSLDLGLVLAVDLTMRNVQCLLRVMSIVRGIWADANADAGAGAGAGRCRWSVDCPGAIELLMTSGFLPLNQSSQKSTHQTVMPCMQIVFSNSKSGGWISMDPS